MNEVYQMFVKNLFFSELYDCYGNLLKDNQATVIDLYYNQDLSLSEIAEELNMSRAGVHDTLKRAEKNLAEFEDRLLLHSKLERINNSAEKIIEIINKINVTEDIKDIKNDLKEIKSEAEKILNEG
jgi:predicted DNA-binding protein YlxM (UPF0122 family)